MKKYFAAGAVAIMVFAFAAFAATLQVNAGPLQAGLDNDLACADSAEITYETQTTGDGEFGVRNVFVDFDAECAESFSGLAAYSGDPQEPGGANQIGMAWGKIDSTGQVTYETNPSVFKPADLEAVAVIVKNQLTPHDGSSTEPYFSGGILQAP